MLEFNPYYRPSANQLLKSKIFDKFQTKQTTPPHAIKFKLDINEDKIDYEKADYRKDLKTKLLQELVDEYKKIKKTRKV